MGFLLVLGGVMGVGAVFATWHGRKQKSARQQVQQLGLSTRNAA